MEDGEKVTRQMMKDDSKREIEEMKHLSEMTEAFSTRCDQVYNFVFRLLAGSTSSTNPDVSMDSLQDNVRSLKATIEGLENQVEELGKARDEALERERRLRRGLYRVSAGRLDIEEVMKVSPCKCGE